MIRTEVLPSGLSLATERHGGRPLGVHRVLGRHRVAGRGLTESGASHFLEHLLFKGTDDRSAFAIAESVDEVGGDFNAFTTKEYTSFYIRLLAEHLRWGWTSSPTSCGGRPSGRATSRPSGRSSSTRS